MMSPVVLVRKKDGCLRICIDLCKVNDLTIKDVYSVSHIQDTLDCLRGDVWLTSLDLKPRKLVSGDGREE